MPIVRVLVCQGDNLPKLKISNYVRLTVMIPDLRFEICGCLGTKNRTETHAVFGIHPLLDNDVGYIATSRRDVTAYCAQ